MEGSLLQEESLKPGWVTSTFCYWITLSLTWVNKELLRVYFGAYLSVTIHPSVWLYIELLTSSSSPWTWHRCSSSGGPGCEWSAGWSRSPSRCRRRRHRGAGRHTASAPTPRSPCAAQCPAADPAVHNSTESVTSTVCFLWSGPQKDTFNKRVFQFV